MDFIRGKSYNLFVTKCGVGRELEKCKYLETTGGRRYFKCWDKNKYEFEDFAINEIVDAIDLGPVTVRLKGGGEVVVIR